ncbi:hypothetical protein C0993_010582 [Termitomyces sp. T159_Od127]|nr:hypothetical protein C0993_010582 [Termitomyces sp. T159_Od127]
MTRFGDFGPLCTSVPSYPWCNLFYRQLVRTGNAAVLVGASASPSTAGVGVNPKCFIAPTFSDPPPHLGNIANYVACAVSFFVTLGLIWLVHRRRAAVGRIELRTLLAVYAVTLPLNAITTGSFIRQGSTALVVLTAIHASPSSGASSPTPLSRQTSRSRSASILSHTTPRTQPYATFSVLLFVLGTYLALKTALGAMTAIGGRPPRPSPSRAYASLSSYLSGHSSPPCLTSRL